MSDDYADFDEVITPDANQLKSIESLVQQAWRLITSIETYESALKAAKADLLQLTHKAIPDAMAAAGTSDFTTTNGVNVAIKDILNGTLPKDPTKRAEALKWLEENGGRAIIKGTITAEFERGADNSQKRNQTAEVLSKLGVDFVEQESVHPQTLAAYARERIKNGEEVPTDLLGLYSGRMAKITVS